MPTVYTYGGKRRGSIFNDAGACKYQTRTHRDSRVRRGDGTVDTHWKESPGRELCGGALNHVFNIKNKKKKKKKKDRVGRGGGISFV